MSAKPSIAKFYRDGEEPVFAAPWEAHAFALTVRLHEQGLFSWTEWSEALAESISIDTEAPYYESWLRAFESLLFRKGIIEGRELLQGIETLNSGH